MRRRGVEDITEKKKVMKKTKKCVNINKPRCSTSAMNVGIRIFWTVKLYDPMNGGKICLKM